MKNSFILGFLYLLIGLLLGFYDPVVVPVYLTVLPFHAFLLYLSIKTKNIVFLLFCIFLFLSHGIGSIGFYLDRDNAQSVGFSAIGNFDFSYERFFSAWSYLVVFLLFLLLFISIFSKRYYRNSYIFDFIKQQIIYYESRSRFKWTVFPLLFFSLLFTAISIWMYNYHIGMIGLNQTALPYHLTGVLFYSRRFVFPLILLSFFFRTKEKFISTIILIIYALLIGILATSKSASLIILIPLVVYHYISGKKKLAFIGFIASVFVYVVVGSVRTVIYEYDAEIDLISLMNNTDLTVQNNKNLILFIVNNVTGRLFGFQCTVLTDQYMLTSFLDLVRFYTYSTIDQIVPNNYQTLFGMNLSDDRAFGVCVGYVGSMQLLSCHNYYYTIIQAFIVSVIFTLLNNSIRGVFLQSSKPFYKWIALFVFLYSFMQFHNGVDMKVVYFSIILLFLIRRISLKKHFSKV